MFVHLMLEAAGLKILVVGGGAVAARKAAGWLNGGAEITLLSPGRQESAWQEIGQKCRWLPQQYNEDFDLSGFGLVIAATNQPDLNRQLAERCRGLGILCNCASEPEAGSVVLPGLVQGETFSLAVSSGGRLPLLTRKLKGEARQLLAAYEQEYDKAAVDLFMELRQQIIGKFANDSRMKQILLRKLAQAKPAELKEFMKNIKLKRINEKRINNEEEINEEEIKAEEIKVKETKAEETKVKETKMKGIKVEETNEGEYDFAAVIDWLQREQIGFGSNQTGGRPD